MRLTMGKTIKFKSDELKKNKKFKKRYEFDNNKYNKNLYNDDHNDDEINMNGCVSRFIKKYK